MAAWSYIAPNLVTSYPTEQKLIDFVGALWLSLALLLLRIVAQSVLPPILRRRLKAVKEGGDKSAEAVLDHMWIAIINGALVVYAWIVTLAYNQGCTPWSTSPCIEDWPNNPVTLIQRWYMVSAFAYYLYELVDTALGIGTVLKSDMVAHHIVTMFLILIGYHINLIRWQVMWTALFDVSNPVLHLAKLLNILDIPQLKFVKWGLFYAFAALFFICRVVMGPFSILLPAFTKAPKVLPSSYCIPLQALAVFIYVLQLVWFYRIVRIAKGGDSWAKRNASLSKKG